MRRLPLLLLVLIAVVACPRDRKDADTIPVDTLVLDTSSADISGITAALPPAEPDTFSPPKPAPATKAAPPAVPAAPAPLAEAAARERTVSEFCYTEFGLKADPSLSGNVGMVVTVGQNGITGARVGRSNWSSTSIGNSVNACLNEKIKSAWKLTPGAVRPGTYQLQLRFRG